MILTYVLMVFMERVNQPDLAQILFYCLIFRAVCFPFEVINAIHEMKGKQPCVK